jgi:microcystin-dependent protein
MEKKKSFTENIKIPIVLAAVLVAAVLLLPIIIYFIKKSNSDLSNDLSYPPAVMRALNAFTATSPKPIFMLTDVNGDISTHDPMTTPLNIDWKIKGNLCIENVCANENDIKNPIGTIFQYAGESPPSSYLICDGRSLQISKYTELYNILGNKYGGDNLNYFNIPDLRGRTIVGTGKGNNLTNRILGTTGGSENETLTIQQMPSHTHSGNTDPKGEHSHPYFPFYDTPSGQLYDCGGGRGSCPYLYNPSGWLDNGGNTDSILNTSSSGNHNHSLTMDYKGNSNNSHNNLQPFLSLNYIIKVY